MGWPYGYAYYGKKKRSAEPEPKAEADPYLLYGGYYGHAGYLGHAGYYGGWPYGYAYYGKKKRSAEPEPKAEADPYLLYGGYYGCRIPWTCRILWRMALRVCLLWLVCAKGQKKARIIYLNSQSLVVKFIFTVHLTYDDLCDLIGHVSAFFGLLSNSKTIHKSD